MPRAIWHGAVIAESDDTVVVEGNHYFPRGSINAQNVVDSTRTSVCPWKGTARYLTLEVDGDRHEDAAWYYPAPSRLARKIRDRVAFGRAVHIEP